MKQFKTTVWYQRAFSAFKAATALQRVLVALAVITVVSVSCAAMG